MEVSPSKQIAFKARISEPVMRKINSQLKVSGSVAKTRTIVQSQLVNISHWGNPDTELVLAKNRLGKIGLGVRKPLDSGLFGTWAIENLNGRTILTNILNLHEAHVVASENTIDYLFKKYGFSVFKNSVVENKGFNVLV